MGDDEASEKAPGLVVGQLIGKYRLTDKLGEGGMGVVFGGIHETLGRNVAIKVLRAEFAKNETVVRRFQQEAEAVSRIGHANIVAVYDLGQLADGSFYYVMERILGETLSDRLLSNPPMSAQEIVAVFSQICRALRATHSQNIVHRDLKPDNVLLQPRKGAMPHVKLLDFGVSKMRAPDGGEAAAASGLPSMTKVGTVLGTPSYMAPEQISSPLTVDGRADLYSLGAMLYLVLTGETPFGPGAMMEILMKHLRDDVVPPSQRAKPGQAIPPELDAFVLKALAKKPEERHSDADDFQAGLEAAFGLSAPRTTSVAGVVPPVALAALPSVAKRRWLVPAAIGGVLLVGGGVAGVVLRPAAKAVAPALPPSESALRREQAQKVIEGAMAADPRQRRAVVDALGEVADRSALPQVIAALRDDNPEVRRAAAHAAIVIGKPGDAELRAVLAEAGARSVGAVAADVAAARFRTGDASAEEDLKRALELPDPAVRLRAAVALADAGKLPAATLRKAISAAPPTVRRSLRWAAFVRLHQLGDQSFDAELKTALQGQDQVARLEAAQTLARGDDSDGILALSDLAAHAPDLADRVDAAAVQAELGDAGARQLLVTALTSEDATVRARAATSLGRLARLLPDHPTLGKKLVRLLDDPAPPVRIAAAAALLALRDAPATPGRTP
ncbi:MAG: hypothetical protein EXR72_20965 [Myxococcales bacterium]|nr:hypothetical protein [Myxococcales bacterium]